MMLSLRAVLLAGLAAGLLQIDAQAQVPDGTALLASAADLVEPMPTEIGEGEIASGAATRREILNRLFAGREVEIEWRNKAFADEKIQSGHLSGPPVELARRLLARVSYVISYDTSSNEPRLARIVVLGSDAPSVTRSAPGSSPARQEAPSATRSAGASSPTRQEAHASEAARRRAAIDAARRAIAAAQRR